jgi:hypothetical protein
MQSHCVSRFIACTGYVSYGVLLRIPLHSIIVDTRDNGHPVPPLVCYNEGLLQFYTHKEKPVYLIITLLQTGRKKQNIAQWTIILMGKFCMFDRC